MSSAIDKVIDVRVKHGPDMDIDDFYPFQGDLKELPKENFEKLKHTIIKEGFADPFNLWFDPEKNKHFICDGHQRQLVLKSMRSEGYMIPKLPTNLVMAKDMEQAKKFVLTFASNYGKITEESLSNYCIDAGISVDFLATSVVLPEVSLDYFSQEDPIDPNSLSDTEKLTLYSKKIQAPIYEPKGEKPAVTELYDLSKQKELISKVLASEVPDEVKEFLIQAANRHSVFSYDKIAEYYAHAPQGVQELMEDSALVIIDFEKAIENGFVVLSQEIAETFSNADE